MFGCPSQEESQHPTGMPVLMAVLALAVTPLLRMISDEFPNSIPRALADDLLVTTQEPASEEVPADVGDDVTDHVCVVEQVA
eukprot:4919938-Alexandrium_andersonii.AAC.1